MKIAVATDNGTTISRHFGRARSYLVAFVEDGVVVAQERRPKAGHDDFEGQGHGAQQAGRPRGYGQGAADKHRAMIDSIRDCNVLIAGGMGQGAREAINAAGIETVMTDEREVSKAIERLVRGDLPNLDNRLH